MTGSRFKVLPYEPPKARLPEEAAQEALAEKPVLFICIYTDQQGDFNFQCAGGPSLIESLGLLEFAKRVIVREATGTD